MNKASEIKTPPIRLFGNVVLLQLIRPKTTLVLPNTMTPGTDNPSSLHIAAIGDGHDVNHKGLAIGDELELVHLAAVTKSNAKFYPGIEDPYMLVGLDNILGVRTD